MNYRPYGKQGFDVSLFGMGCMRLPRCQKEDGTVTVDRGKAYELIRYAAEHGVNYFDTAFSYHRKTSEEIVGEALEGEYRKRVKIATKQPLTAMKTQGDIRRNLENTLKKLRTDYVDTYLIHAIRPDTWDTIQKRNIIQEFEKFREEGLIKSIGFSYHGNYKTFAEILKFYPWDMCQVQQNFLDSEKEVTTQGIRLAGEMGTALVIMEPLRGGGIANAPQDIQKLYDDFPVKRTPAEWGFRYLYNFPQVSCILSGVTTMDQLKDNIRIFSQSDAVPCVMTKEEGELIQHVKKAYETRPVISCTGCEYCVPCPNGVNIPAVFSRYNSALMLGSYEAARRSYMLLRDDKQDVSHCVECGLCETKCPQDISIMKELKNAHEKLDGWYE